MNHLQHKFLPISLFESKSSKSFVYGFDYHAFYGMRDAIISGIPETGDSTEGYLRKKKKKTKTNKKEEDLLNEVSSVSRKR